MPEFMKDDATETLPEQTLETIFCPGRFRCSRYHHECHRLFCGGIYQVFQFSDRRHQFKF